jgi:hypothetical protein
LQGSTSDFRKRRAKLYQAHIDGKVPDDVFEELKAALEEESMQAELELSSARLDEIKVDEVLEFCERLLCNVPMMWKDCTIDQQQRLQKVLFPQGISHTKNGTFITPTTCLFFNMLEDKWIDKTVW